MNFSDKIKTLRKEAKLSQRELAKIIGVSERTVQNYEGGTSLPRTSQISHKICNAFNITFEELFSKEDNFIIDACEKGGSRAKKDVDQLISEVSGLFAGGELGDDDKEAVMLAIMDAYWMAKKENKKYTPNKFKTKEEK